MNVLFLARPGTFESHGGDRIQIENTAEELRKMKVGIDIRTDLSVEFSKYDIIHIFQLDWNPYSYFFAKKAKKAGKKVILSPIHHSFKDVKRFDDTFPFDFRRLTKFFFRNQYFRDQMKELYRSFFQPSHFPVTLFLFINGYEYLYKKTLEMSDIVLVQTEEEARDLKETFGIDIVTYKVSNGVGKNFVDAKEYVNILGITDYIICVGRIEPRKNQLSIIKAVKELREEDNIYYQLVLIGKASNWKHFEYNFRFHYLAVKNPWIHHIEYVPYNLMPSYYRYAKVTISASWFETTGLTLLEGISSGCNAVASGERAKEFLGDKASYCDPGDLKSIKEALRNELLAPRPDVKQLVKKEFTWESAAKRTLEIYSELLKIPVERKQ